ncbi:unnamed protein product [Closterium sp. NIES-65]|nr:unnamed protein product [Closterium sp. NIES-65]
MTALPPRNGRRNGRRKGDGVVEQPPVLRPGVSFEYTYVCPLDTRKVAMVISAAAGAALSIEAATNKNEMEKWREVQVWDS